VLRRLHLERKLITLTRDHNNVRSAFLRLESLTESEHIAEQVRRMLVALLAIFLQGLADDGVETGGNAWIYVAGGQWRESENRAVNG
jgi:hypothetical protein